MPASGSRWSDRSTPSRLRRKAVEDYRTPRRFAKDEAAATSARSWSAPVLWRFGTALGSGSWLLLDRFRGLLEVGQFLFPVGGLGGFGPGVVELHQPFEGFRDAARGVENGRQAGLALNEAFVALPQQRFGFGVFRLACETAAEEADQIETVSGVGKKFVGAARAFTQERFRLDPLPLRQPNSVGP